jgi:protein-tyrosine phosphatase
MGICFVCLGNICRSPTAEGIFRHLLAEARLGDRIVAESAGTGAWHVGERPDRRALATARRRGLELPGTARLFEPTDFERFEYVVAMDGDTRSALLASAPDRHARSRVHLLRAFDPANTAIRPDLAPDVPDPYYGGPDGFDRVFDICEAACRGLLDHLRRTHDGLE